MPGCVRHPPGGAIDGARTRDIQDHNLALYQLSYDRHRGGPISYAERAACVNAPSKCRASRSSASVSTAGCLQKANRA